MKLFSKVLVAFISIFIAYFFLQLFNYSSLDDGQKINNDFTKSYNIQSVELPTKIDFAGEDVPLKYFDVRESLDREIHVNTYWQSQTLLLIKMVNRYFGVIEPILKKNNIPDDFKYLAVAESGLRNVVSPSGARGYWQFLDRTAKDYNLEVNSEVDERYCIEKSTQAACDYLNESYKTYKNWTLVAASYNMGVAGLNKQIEKQKVNNYYDLLLNEETSRYVFRILAMKLILSQPDKYGFHVLEKDKYFQLEFDTVHVDTTISDFADFAILHGTNYKMLKTFNPWLRDKSLTVKEKTYIIKIPKQGFRDFIFEEQESDTLQ